MNLSVLVVEDDADVRASLVEILRHEGHVPVEAANGLAARDILHDQPVDVVLLDLRLPGVDGPGLLAGLDDPPPVIVLSAFATYDEEDVCRRLAGKVSTFIRKPSPPHVVLAAIEDVARG